MQSRTSEQAKGTVQATSTPAQAMKPFVPHKFVLWRSSSHEQVRSVDLGVQFGALTDAGVLLQPEQAASAATVNETAARCNSADYQVLLQRKYEDNSRRQGWERTEHKSIRVKGKYGKHPPTTQVSGESHVET